MDSLMKELEDRLGANDDFFIQPDKIGGASVVLMGFITLIDLTRTKIAIHKNSENASRESGSVESVMAAIPQHSLLYARRSHSDHSVGKNDRRSAYWLGCHKKRKNGGADHFG